jgi:hypothetical protein
MPLATLNQEGCVDRHLSVFRYTYHQSCEKFKFWELLDRITYIISYQKPKDHIQNNLQYHNLKSHIHYILKKLGQRIYDLHKIYDWKKCDLHGTSNRVTTIPQSGKLCRNVYVTEFFFLLKIFVITKRSLKRKTSL